MFNLGLGEAADDGGRDSLTLKVFQTSGPGLDGGASRPLLVQRIPPAGQGVTITSTDLVGHVCFAAIVTDLTQRPSTSGPVVCADTIAPPFFYSCGVLTGRRPAGSVSLAILALLGVGAGRRRRQRRGGAGMRVDLMRPSRALWLHRPGARRVRTEDEKRTSGRGRALVGDPCPRRGRPLRGRERRACLLGRRGTTPRRGEDAPTAGRTDSARISLHGPGCRANVRRPRRRRPFRVRRGDVHPGVAAATGRRAVAVRGRLGRDGVRRGRAGSGGRADADRTWLDLRLARPSSGRGERAQGVRRPCSRASRQGLRPGSDADGRPSAGHAERARPTRRCTRWGIGARRRPLHPRVRSACRVAASLAAPERIAPSTGTALRGRAASDRARGGAREGPPRRIRGVAPRPRARFARVLDRPGRPRRGRLGRGRDGRLPDRPFRRLRCPRGHPACRAPRRDAIGVAPCPHHRRRRNDRWPPDRAAGLLPSPARRRDCGRGHRAPDARPADVARKPRTPSRPRVRSPLRRGKPPSPATSPRPARSRGGRCPAQGSRRRARSVRASRGGPH